MNKAEQRKSMKLDGKVCIITGGAGLLGHTFSEAILDAKGKVCILDINDSAIQSRLADLEGRFPGSVMGVAVDIRQEEQLLSVKDVVLSRFGRIDVLVNNAANNPKVEQVDKKSFSRLEFFPLAQWVEDVEVGLTGAFLCSKVFGTEMARKRSGAIVNICSDLGLIAPDQRLYRIEGLPDDAQPVKPVTYSVIKHGLIGLTKYLATYWADKGVRVNSLCPGGVRTNQPTAFVDKISQLIPLGRMAQAEEYKEAIVFLSSDASSYMTGQNLIIDGGRTAW
jgi:NAD(P)-dependent dehydrogenase (short-subunit alcohol dehydrogenase family)